MAFNKNTNDLTESIKDSDETYLSSIETAFSLSTELSSDSPSHPTKPSKPQSQVHLFTEPSPSTVQKYSELFSKLNQTIKELEDLSLGVNIRDDCSFQPKQVLLHIPKRRNTSISY